MPGLQKYFLQGKTVEKILRKKNAKIMREKKNVRRLNITFGAFGETLVCQWAGVDL